MPFNQENYWRGPAECARLEAQGVTVEEIAKRFKLKPETVRTYLSRHRLAQTMPLQMHHGEAAGGLSAGDIEGLLRRLDKLISTFASDADFARQVGISPQGAHHWRCKGIVPRASMITQICLRLDVSADWLLLGKGAPPAILMEALDAAA